MISVFTPDPCATSNTPETWSASLSLLVRYGWLMIPGRPETDQRDLIIWRLSELGFITQRDRKWIFKQDDINLIRLARPGHIIIPDDLPCRALQPFFVPTAFCAEIWDWMQCLDHWQSNWFWCGGSFLPNHTSQLNASIPSSVWHRALGLYWLD